MKKVLLGIVLVLLLLVGGGMYYVFTNLDQIVERGIETAGTEAAGSAVEVEGVELDLMGGSAIIRGFTLANPPGYSNAAMLSFDELAVVIDVANMDRNNIRIVSITGRNPHLLYEAQGTTSNLDVVRERVASNAPPADETSGPDINLEIGSIVIEGIHATVSSNLLPSSSEVDLGDVRLENIRGTPAEIAHQVLRPLLTQLALNAGRVALTLLPEDVRAAGGAIRDAAAAGLEQAGGGLREGLGGLLGGNDDDEEEAEAEEAPADAPPQN